jgi:hypothetical protein
MRKAIQLVGHFIFGINILFLACAPAIMVILHDRDAAINKHHPHTPFCIEGICIDTTSVK